MIERLRAMSRWELALLVICGVTIAVWVWQVWMRGRYDLDLEWMESGALHQAHRIMQGASAYPSPSSEFVPHLYTPGYSVVLAFLGVFFPLDFGLARCVSLLSILATAVALFKIVLREGRPAHYGLVATAVYLSSFRFCYRWMDLARSDALMVALVLWGLYFLRSGWGHVRNVVLAGVFMAAAYWVKQSAFTIIVGSGVAAMWVAPRLVWTYVLTVGVLGGLGTLIYNWLSDGWLWYYIFELHQSHRFNVVRLRQKTWGMILHCWPFAMAMLGVWLWRTTSPWLLTKRKLDKTLEQLALARQSANSGPIYWWILLCTTAAAGAISYSTQWAEPNAFLPFCACLGALLAILLDTTEKSDRLGKGLIIAQLGFLLVFEPHYAPVQAKGLRGLKDSYHLWDPWLGQPTLAHLERAQALSDQWDDLSFGAGIQDSWGVRHQGTLLALQHPWWGIRVGGQEHVASMALNDLGAKAGAPVRKELAKRIEQGEFAALWVEGKAPRWLAKAMGSNYGLAKKLTGDERVLPLSGWMSKAGTLTAYERAQRLYLATSAIPLPEGCTRVADFEDATSQGLVVTQGDLSPGPVPRLVRDAFEYEGGAGQYAWVSRSRRGGLASQGKARLALPTSGDWHRLVIGAAWLGARQGLSLSLVRPGERLELSLPKEPALMQQVGTDLPSHSEGWVLEIQDATERGLLVLDEIWVCSKTP